jgi:hypothetical protein
MIMPWLPDRQIFEQFKVTDCQDCPNGTYSNASSSACAICPLGTFSYRGGKLFLCLLSLTLVYGESQWRPYKNLTRQNLSLVKTSTELILLLN